MKKGIIIFFSIIGIMLIVSFIITSNNSNKEEFVLCAKEAHSVTFNDEAIIDIPVYYTNENVFNVSSSINSVSLSNLNTKVTCELKELTNNGIARYEDTNYYLYNYRLMIPCLNDLFIDDALLTIESCNSKLEIEVGTIALRYIEDLGEPKDITINSSSVLAKSQTIEGIIIEIENKTDYDVEIKNIEVDGNKVFVDLNNIKQIYKSYNESESILDIIEGYNLYTKQPNFTLNEFVINGKINVVLPLKYLDKVLLLSTPIIITYEINGVSDKYILDDITYVNHLNKIVDIGGIYKCQL